LAQIDPTHGTLVAVRPDGRRLTFARSVGTWYSQPDIVETIKDIPDANGVVTARSYYRSDGAIESYDVSGRLTQVRFRTGASVLLAYSSTGLLSAASDQFGRQLAFAFDGSGSVASMFDPSGTEIKYGYDATGNLVSVTYPSVPPRSYLYNEPDKTAGANYPYALTDIVDENGDRFATFQYAAGFFAISSSHAVGSDEYGFSFGGSASTTITDPLGTQRTYAFATMVASLAGEGVC